MLQRGQRALEPIADRQDSMAPASSPGSMPPMRTAPLSGFDNPSKNAQQARFATRRSAGQLNAFAGGQRKK